MDKRVLIYMIFLGLSFYMIQTFFAPKSTYKFPTEQSINLEKETKQKTEILPAEETFYVLENEYQQIVFSDMGGSIAEINLPLKNKDNKSIIYPIEFDQIIDKTSPENAHFPQRPYSTYDKKNNVSPKVGGYYPLLRRSIYNNEDQVSYKMPSKYYSMNIFDEENNISDTKFKVVRFEKNLIEFEGNANGNKINKIFYFDESTKTPYLLNLKLKVNGKNKKMWLTSGVLDVELTSNAFIPSFKYRILKGTKYSTENISIPKTENTGKEAYIDWLSNSNGFFGIIMDPEGEVKGSYISDNIPGSKVPSRISVIDSQYNRYPAQKYPGYNLLLPIPSASEEINFRIFAGPYQDELLKDMSAQYEKPYSGYNPDYISVKSSQGWFSFASEPFAKFLLILMRLFYAVSHSWGFSIILLTIAFRIMLYPLNSWSIKSTMQMQEITPLLKVIDAKYKKDPKQANIEKMKIFKEKGANPLSGCLPILIQLPFLFGMFNLLKNTFELRGVPFIPGWIDNLAAPDVLFSWNYPIFILGTQFHFLPVLLGIVMFIQSKMNMKLPKDKSLLTDQQKQQIIMTWAMPVLFTFLFYKAASGLNIYFFFSMLLGIVQQWYMSRAKNKKALKVVK